MRISKEGQEAIESIRLISGENLETVRNVFEALINYFSINYMDNRSITIPFIGEMKVTYLRDEIKKEGKQAVVEISMLPDSALLKIVGQIQDKEEVDTEKSLKQKVGENLGKYLE